jgi:hypothetical protein
MSSGPIETTSSYNEGMFQIQRLHLLWSQANHYSRSGNFRSWRWTLDTIWRELSNDAIKKEAGNISAGEFKKTRLENAWFKEYERLNKNISVAVDGSGVYVAISELEIFLRTLQQVVGKGGKYKREDEDDMD